MSTIFGILHFLFFLVFLLLGLGGLYSSWESKHLGVFLRSLSYVGGAFAAVALLAWWPFIVALVLAPIVRKLFGDPSDGRV